MAGQVTDYHRGQMNIHQQQSTFHRVVGMTKWVSLAVAAGVLFLTLWFCTPAGFPSALASAVVLLAIGAFALRGRKSSAH